MSGASVDTNRYAGTWIATWAIPATVQIALSLVVATGATFGSATAMFWLVVIAASLCVITAVLVIARAFVTEQADLGAVGLLFFSASGLPLVHGLTAPGVLVGDNTSTSVSVLLAIPVGLLAVTPLVVPNQSAWIRGHWRRWVAGAFVAITALCGALLFDLNLLPAPEPRSALTVSIAVISFGGCVALSYRHLRLARIAQSRSPLVVAAGYGLLGSSAFVWLAAMPFTTAFWVAHILDISGVFAATIGALVIYARTRSVQAVVEPVLIAEPTRALEIGLDPLVHRYVAELEAKDPITRDHVIRTAELAMRVGDELWLGPDELRLVGLTAVLHDVGKLAIPDEILNKPGRLTDEEFAVIRTHTDHGAALVAASPSLRDIAEAVRAHHERLDGTGYPDGMSGDAIPLAARIVAVCDAFDAMANTRQYRDGMGSERAISILQEHAGSQWDPAAVRALVRVVRRDPPTSEPGPLDDVGRTVDPPSAERIGCDCVPEPLLVSASLGASDSSGGDSPGGGSSA